MAVVVTRKDFKEGERGTEMKQRSDLKDFNIFEARLSGLCVYKGLLFCK
jgi:hypothetical protein